MAAPDDKPRLPRKLHQVDATALVVSNVIGVGIFTTPGVVAGLVPSFWPLIGVWIAGGILAVLGARSYAELAALRPEAGGEYVFLRDAFGPMAGFLSGWTSFVAGFSGAIAASAIGFAVYLGRYFPWAANATPLASASLGPITLSVSPRTMVALAAVCGVSALHVLGLNPGRILQNGLAWVNVSFLLALLGAGFALGHGSAAYWKETGAVRPLNWLIALIPVMFTYSGWNAAAYVSEEVREAPRTVGRALMLGTVLVTILYVLLNVLVVYAVPLRELKATINAGDAAAAALFGANMARALTPIFLVALAGAISAMVLAGPRVYFAMARDGRFFQFMAEVHPRFQTPARAILAQTVWVAVLLVSGTFEQLLIYTGFAVVLFSGLAVVGLFVLRQRSAGRDYPFARWRVGRVVGPGVFLAMSAAMLVNAIYQLPRTSLLGLLVIAAGVPVFFWGRGRSSTGRS
jgi:basic amino acid/polyamine antiporter, APA family